ncbi:MAG TPA: hypothetical protein VH643_30185 [Gemmataceae bacterium]
MTERNPVGEDNAKLTAAGCVLALLSVAVIFVAAIPIVRWRDAATGESLPHDVAIATPFVLAAAFYGIGTVLLRVVGLRIWSKSETDESCSPKE